MDVAATWRLKDGLKPGGFSPGAARGVRTGKSSGGGLGGGTGVEDRGGRLRRLSGCRLCDAVLWAYVRVCSLLP